LPQETRRVAKTEGSADERAEQKRTILSKLLITASTPRMLLCVVLSFVAASLSSLYDKPLKARLLGRNSSDGRERILVARAEAPIGWRPCCPVKLFRMTRNSSPLIVQPITPAGKIGAWARSVGRSVTASSVLPCGTPPDGFRTAVRCSRRGASSCRP